MATADILALRTDAFAGGRLVTERGTGAFDSASLLNILQRLARSEMPEFTTALRPAATAVPASSLIRNTTTGTIQMSDGAIWQEVLVNQGVIPSARLNLATQPPDTETVTIDGHIFQFDAAQPPIAAGGAARTAVFRGANAAEARTNLIAAINGTVDANNVTPGTGALGAVASLVADNPAGSIVRVRRTTTRGSAAAIAPGLLAGALADGLGAAADVWNVANLNVSGRVRGALRYLADTVIITAAMVTFGSMNIELPFTPTHVLISTRTTAGVQVARDEAVTIDGDSIDIVLAGGIAPNYQADDIVSFVALG